MEPTDVLKEGTVRARARLSPRLIVLGLFLMLVVFGIIIAVRQGPGDVQAMTAAFECPPAPAPFVLEQNLVIEEQGEYRYIACAWVGGIPADSPLP